jgi:tetratricopeptide (TPR) repeat protein
MKTPARSTPSPAGGAGIVKVLSSPVGAGLLVFAVAFVLYANTLGHDFVWDDRDLIVDNPAVRTLDGETLRLIFFEDFWRTIQRGGGYYRPLVTLSYHIHYKVFDGNPAGFHLVNVLWNALVCTLVFVFVRLLFRNGLFALTAALIFAVHPVHTENVAWISGRTDLLATLWMMVSLVCYVAARQRRNFWYLVAALLAFLIALFAKESAACLPLIIALLEFGPFAGLLSPNTAHVGRKPTAGRSVFNPVLYLAVLVVYILLRREAIGTVGSTYESYAPGLAGVVGLPLAILAGYTFKLFFPFNLNGEYDAPVPDSVVDPHVIAGLAIAALLVYAIARFRRRSVVVLGAGIFLLGLGPVANVIPIGEISAERFLYFPSIGFALVFGGIFSSALTTRFQALRRTVGNDHAEVIRMSRGYAGVLCAVLAVAMVAFAARTVTRNPDWKTEDVLFVKTAAGAPESFRAQLGVGNVNRRQGRLDAAVAAYKKALVLKPDYADALSNLAGVYVQQGKIDEALPLLENALRAAPNNLQLLNNLGSIYFEKKQFAAAAQQFEKVISIDPEQLNAQFNLGLIYFREREAETARRHFELVAGKHSRFDMAYYYLAVIEDDGGNAPAARRYARSFLDVYKKDDPLRTRAQTIAGGE